MTKDYRKYKLFTNITEIDELVSNSDIKDIVDNVSKKIDDVRYMIIFMVDKQGRFKFTYAGITSPLELAGISNFTPEIIDVITDEMFSDDSESSK